MINLNPKLKESYEVGKKATQQEFRHVTLGLINFATINDAQARHLEIKGYLKKKDSPPPKAKAEVKGEKKA